MTDGWSLADRWRADRPQVAGVHLDSAACSRQSLSVIDASARHARHEAELGGYRAAEAAAPLLDAGRAAIGALVGMDGADVVFTTGANRALDLLLSSWPGERTLACLPGEYGPNLAVMAANGFAVRPLPVDALGRLAVNDAARELAEHRPALVHLTALASHRGLAQPLTAMAAVCREFDLPLVVDGAQALGHLDCAVGAAAVYGTSRKWLAGPRGVGVLAVAPELAGRLAPRLPPPSWGPPSSALPRLELGEANVGDRVGFSLAVGEHLTAGEAAIRDRLAHVGAVTRAVVDGAAGWRVVEPAEEPTAITTLRAPAGVEPARVRAQLLSEYAVVTTVAEPVRAPFELAAPVLRLSPHVDVTHSELEVFVKALVAVTCSQ